MATMPEYIAYMEQYCDFFNEVVVTWQKKHEILVNNAWHEMEEQSKREEVALLQSRGMEKKRLEMQKAMGCPDATLQMLIDQSTGTEQQQLRDIKTRLNWAVSMIRNLNEACETLTNQRLGQIAGEIERLNKKVEDEKKSANHSVMNRSI